MKTKTSKGQSLIELVLVIGLMAILLPAYLTGYVNSLEGKPQEKNRQQALGIAQSRVEELLVEKEDTWNNFTAGIYDTDIVDTIFTVIVTLEDVYRDGNGDVAPSGTLDPSTYYATISVNWSEPTVSSVEIPLYITRSDNNYTHQQTTEADFLSGSFTSTETTNNNGGEVVLTNEGVLTWDNLSIIDSFDRPGTSDGYSLSLQGNYLYGGFASSSGSDLYIFDVSDPSNISMVGELDMRGSVYDLKAVGNYLYVANSRNDHDFQIYDISDPSNITFISDLEIGDTRNAFSINVEGNYAYLGKDASGGSNREIYVIDNSDINNPSIEAGIEVGSDVNDILIENNYLYAATDKNSGEIQVYDITNTPNIQLIEEIDLDGNANGEKLFIENDRLYLARSSNTGGDKYDFYIINKDDPTNLSVVGGFDRRSRVNNIYINGDYAFLANDVNDYELTILDISDETNPTELSYLALNGDARDITMKNGYLLLTTENNNQEVMVIQGNSSGSGYATSGTFESQSFNAGDIVGFNYLEFDYSEPTNTNLNIQIAVNTDNSTWNFVGPDGTATTYFDGDGGIPLIAAEGQYLKIKGYFTSDGTDTPILESFRINYAN